MKVDKNKYCVFLKKKCMYAGNRCVDCPVTETWNETVSEMVNYLLEDRESGLLEEN